MRNINRWSLMRNTQGENLAEHSYFVSVIAHCLAFIRRDVFGLPADAEKIAAAALYHDISEILTGDMPTPVKYYNQDIKDAYKKIEEAAAKKLILSLPLEIRESYDKIMNENHPEVLALIRAADKISAYIKCTEELRAGNAEFLKASEQLKKSLDEMDLKEVKYFMENFMPAYSLTLDEL